MSIAARNAILAGGAALPYDAEVEYLESSGTQYIDLDYFVGAKLDIHYVVKASSIIGSENDLISNQDARTGRFVMGVYQQSGVYKSFAYSRWGDATESNAIVNIAANDVLDIRCVYDTNANNKELIINNNRSLINSCRNISNTNRRVRIFGGINDVAGGVLAFPFYGNIYSLTLEKDNIKWYDFIPVRFTNELGVSEGAMYDKVSGTLFRNTGTGAFVIGPDASAA